ncbi:glycosyltransferase family 4 protein [Patescibacteria group bacterium]|nr:glycosyltransferase family 4 protein [Patescibacteria group bacterium]
MKIGIDITPAIYHRGVSRYTVNLAKNLNRELGVELSLFASSLRQGVSLKEISKDILSYSPKISTQASLDKKCKILPYPQSILEKMWQFGLNPVSNYLKNLDVFHSWDWIQPPDKNIPIVSTIHDLAILKFPETAHPQILRAHKRSWAKLKENKSHLIAVSRATKKDIMDLLGFPSYMIHVVHEALPEEFKKASDIINEEIASKIKNKLKLNKPYILFVGTREPRKNLLRLVEAWQPLADDFELLVAGNEGWDQVEEKSKQFEHEPRFMGIVNDRELSVLYSYASVFAYPSLYEGFGLPILESFYLGTPVLTSNSSGMIEVAGNAAELIDPESPADITRGLRKILNENKEEQQKRIQRMIIRQQMFDWKKVARETIEVYKRAIEDFKQ